MKTPDKIENYSSPITDEDFSSFVISKEAHEAYLRAKYGKEDIVKNHPMLAEFDLLINLRWNLQQLDDASSTIEINDREARKELLEIIAKTEAVIIDYLADAVKRFDPNGIPGVVRIMELAIDKDRQLKFREVEVVNVYNAWHDAVRCGPHKALLENQDFLLSDEEKFPSFQEVVNQYTDKRLKRSEMQRLRNILKVLGLPLRKGNFGRPKGSIKSAT